MTRTIYVVMGSHGVYSDYCEWMIAAYETRALAETHLDKLARFIANVLAEKSESDCLDNKHWETELDHGPYPDLYSSRIDVWTYPDRQYSIEELQMRDEVPND